jgi:tetratricopeptide (TPR) repeat protein
VALGLLVLLVGGLVWRLQPFGSMRSSSKGDTGSSGVRVRRSVAVLGFRNLSSNQRETAWLATALGELLAAELGAGGDLRTISGEDVSRAKVELAVGDPSNVGELRLQHLGTNLGADLVLAGTYLALGQRADGKLRLDMQVRGAAHGEVLAKVSDTGTEAELLELISRVGASLRQQLGLSRLSTAQAREVASTLPEGSDATRLYAEGLAQLRGGDFLGARAALERAAAAAPDSPLVHSALAATWLGLGDKVKARESARQALARAGKLAGKDRLWVEGLAHEAAEEWDPAIQSYQALWTAAPDDVEYGLRLATVQLVSNRGPDAPSKTLAALRALPAPASQDPRIDLLEARAAQAASDFKREQQVAAHAATRAETLGARLLVARARQYEGWALAMLGDNAGALGAYEEARRICDAADQKECIAITLEGSGLIRSDMGDLPGAKARLESALALRQELGAQSGQLSTLNNLAYVLEQMGDLTGARTAHETSLALARQLGIRLSVGYALANLGNLLQQEGRLAEAAKNYQEGVGIFREGKDARGLAECLKGLGEVRLQQGDLAGAQGLLQEALATLRGLGVKDGLAPLLEDVGLLQRLRGDLPAAHRTQDEVLAVANELGERSSTARAQVAQAELALDEGHAAEAERLARQGLETFIAQKLPAAEAHARDVLALALLAERKLRDAQAELSTAEALYGKGTDRSGRAGHWIAAARVAGAVDAGRAARRLEAELGEISRLGRMPLEYEARLALGELELSGDHAAAGKKRLRALVKDARGHQFLLVARKAAVRL